MCWGFVIGKASASLIRVNINPYLILFLAILPDVDLLLGVFGLRHRTWTHSVLIWTLIFIPFFVKYRTRAFPYFLSLIQHIVLGDFIVGERNYPFWPVSLATLSLGFGPVSAVNLAVEGVGLALFTALVGFKNEIRREFFVKGKLLVLIVLVPVVGFIILAYTYHYFIDYLVSNNLIRASSLVNALDSITGNPLFQIIIVMHVIMGSILSFFLLQGLKSGQRRSETNKNK